MTELLKQYGFVFMGTCNCDGHFTMKFRKGKYQVKWRTKRDQFKIKHNGGTIVNWTPTSALENHLKEIHVQVA